MPGNPPDPCPDARGPAEPFALHVRTDAGYARVVGRSLVYVGAGHASLRGISVVTVALLKADGRYLTSDGEVGRAGGIGPGDGLEVAPVMAGGRE